MSAYNISVIILFLAAIIYEKLIRPLICRKKIIKSIEANGGIITKITKLNSREETYSIEYKLAYKNKTSVANLDFFFNITWM